MHQVEAFHVTVASLFVGDAILPIRHGGQYRQFTPTSAPSKQSWHIDNVLWEIALETARVAGAPQKPSRLDSVFAWARLEDAIWFAHRRGREASILKIAAPRDTLIHRGDFDLLSQPFDGAYVDHLITSAWRYWTEAPTGRIEMVIGGPVQVIAVVEAQKIQNYNQ